MLHSIQPPAMPLSCLQLACALALGLAAPTLRAGDLNPPPGPVAPTLKPLTDVEPRTAVQSLPGDANSIHVISAPGSYYCTADILGAAGMNAIKITASDVTLDLNGFRLVGVPGSLNGVTASGNGIVVENGHILDWGARGVEASAVNSGRFQRLTVSGSGNKGLAAGNHCSILDCVANSNTDDGIFSNAGGLISRCVSNQNNQDGFDLSVGCVITDCVGDANGVSGVFTVQSTVVTNFAARGNASHGVQVGEGSVVTNCLARQNAGDGVRTAASCMVEGCTLTNNAADGVRVSNNCRVVNNHCVFNGTGGAGSGVHTTGARNLVDANTCFGNTTNGILIDSTGSTITRNTVSGSATNYNIALGNDAAPITTAAAATSPLTNIEN